MVDTRDINLLGTQSEQLVTIIVTKTLNCDKNCDNFVKSKLSRNTKKVISFNDLTTCPLGGIW